MPRVLRVAALLGALALPLPGPPLDAQETAASDSRSEDLARIRARVATLESEADRVGAQERDLVGEVARNRAALALQGARVEEARAAQRASLEALDRAEREERRLRGRIETLRGALAGRISALYRFGAAGYARLLLTLGESDDLVPAMRQLRYLTRRDARALAELEAAQEELERTLRTIARRREEATAWLEEQQSRERELARRNRRQRELLAELEQRRSRLEAAAAALRTRGERLDRLMTLLAEEGGSGLSGLAIQEFRGALDWPLEGRVTGEFGPRRDPKYGTVVPHNGIEIAPRGDPAPRQARVLFPGRVVFAGPFRDLGLVVVVQHEGDVLSLYSGLERIEVAVGDVVTFRVPVGVVGSRLYLELREGREPQDPRTWLR